MTSKNRGKVDDMITVQEAAALKGVSRSRIHQWISEGRLSKEERYGRTVVSQAEVLSLQEQKRGPKPGRPSKKAAKKSSKK